jgi:hypothetical protein
MCFNTVKRDVNCPTTGARERIRLAVGVMIIQFLIQSPPLAVLTKHFPQWAYILLVMLKFVWNDSLPTT